MHENGSEGRLALRLLRRARSRRRTVVSLRPSCRLPCSRAPSALRATSSLLGSSFHGCRASRLRAASAHLAPVSAFCSCSVLSRRSFHSFLHRDVRRVKNLLACVRQTVIMFYVSYLTCVITLVWLTRSCMRAALIVACVSEASCFVRYVYTNGA